jgi:LacI family transcriptional regulator
MSVVEGPSRSKPTLRDVASLADVSPTTVSLLLHGRTSVCTTQTALRIKEAIEKLGYVGPNGRDLKPVDEVAAKRNRRTTDNSVDLPIATSYTMRQQKIGISLPPPHGMVLGVRGGEGDTSASDLYHSISDQIAVGLKKAANREDYCLIAYPDSLRSRDEGACLFSDSEIGGLIIAAEPPVSPPVNVSKPDLPVVLLGYPAMIPEKWGAVFAREDEAVHLAMSHLWDLGHRRIAHLAGPVREEGSDNRLEDASGIAGARLSHYREWMKLRNSYRSELVSFSGSWQPLVTATKALNFWLQLPEPPTAMFCSTDVLALAVMEVAAAKGLRIPADLSIVGVDNVVARKPILPPLTSVVIPGEQIGNRALYLLQRMIEKLPIQELHIGLPVTELSVGGTTGPYSADQ